MRPATGSDLARPRWTWWARWVIGVVATVCGVTFSVYIAAAGHCSAYGGRCPAEPEPLLQNDVFVFVTAALAIAVWVVAVCLQPNRRGAAVGLLAGLVLGVLTGLAVAV